MTSGHKIEKLGCCSCHNRGLAVVRNRDVLLLSEPWFRCQKQWLGCFVRNRGLAVVIRNRSLTIVRNRTTVVCWKSYLLIQQTLEVVFYRFVTCRGVLACTVV